MNILIVGLHAGNAPRLQALLGPAHTVHGCATFPASGPIEADVVITNKIEPAQAQRLRCRLLQVPGAGMEQIALDCVPASSWVANVHGHEIPIAEYVMHALLEHAIAPWNLPARLDETAWPAIYAKRPLHNEVWGKTLVIVGYGHIGREIARRAKAFAMRVVAVTRTGALISDDHIDEVLRVDQLHDVLPRTDALALCCPLNGSTRGLVGAAELGLLPPHAVLVNVARAEVVDEQALYDALSQGRLNRAVLDVWYQYPGNGDTHLAPSSLPLHTLPNVRATPHISAMTPGLLERRYDIMAQNILALASDAPLRYVIRKPG